MYDFLLVINTKLSSTLHRFRDIAFDRSKIALYLANPLAFNSPDGGGGWFSWDDLRKICCECQRMDKVPNGVEKLPKFLTGRVGCMNVTDRQMTDGRQHIANVEHFKHTV